MKKSRCRRQGRAQLTPRSGLDRRRCRRRPTSSSCANDPSMLGLVMPPHLHTDTRRHLVRRVFGAELVTPFLIPILLLLTRSSWIMLRLVDLDFSCYHCIALGRTAPKRKALGGRALSLCRRSINVKVIFRIRNTHPLSYMNKGTLVAIFLPMWFLHLDFLNLLACGIIACIQIRSGLE